MNRYEIIQQVANHEVVEVVENQPVREFADSHDNWRAYEGLLNLAYNNRTLAEDIKEILS